MRSPTNLVARTLLNRVALCRIHRFGQTALLQHPPRRFEQEDWRLEDSALVTRARFASSDKLAKRRLPTWITASDQGGPP